VTVLDLIESPSRGGGISNAATIVATYGPPAIIAEDFADLHGADAVLLYGSWAARYLGTPGRTPNDIDFVVHG
jgi:hypothetical protein